jgi:RNA polymerase sigma-70 factor, ECF subfamily
MTVTEEADFARMAGPYRPELLAHCYRMLGSVHDAEDQLQETMIRAWRSYGQFERRSSLRTWLYRIATNTCLRAIETRQRRPLPSGLGQPSDNPSGPLDAPMPEVPWLEPFPDSLMKDDGVGADPASVVTSHTNIRLALIAALQYLPPRQRAVLILRDVLDWRAAEVAELLNMTTVAVNSALQRAREQLQAGAPVADDMREPSDPAVVSLLNRYAEAFENADVVALTGLLRDDVVVEMPPIPTWFAGVENAAEFLRSKVLLEPGEKRLVPTTANGQPALAEYVRDADGVYQGVGIQVLTVAGSKITRISAFFDPSLVTAFGLPAVL